ncbi:GH23410 [Drosophila grimshawi]|uniref:GH23410 n=1 Tax=Drosophila grimshawi TaxID=7222 RepID=B4K3A3_DROGR|nr:GH23410 [Drosophila grimshawi]
MANYGDYDNLDALLADLQNSVPGQPAQSQPQYGTVQPKPQQQQQQQQFVDNTPGYGSLRGKAQPQVYQEHYSVETRSPTAADFNGSSSQQSNGYQNHQATGSLPRQPYKNGQGGAQNTSGLSELDSLLQDLQNARYNNSATERKVGSIEEQIVQQKESYSPNLAAPAPQHQGYTSQATKELDDLMASLSDFKVS